MGNKVIRLLVEQGIGISCSDRVNGLPPLLLQTDRLTLHSISLTSSLSFASIGSRRKGSGFAAQKGEKSGRRGGERTAAPFLAANLRSRAGDCEAG